MFDPRLTRNLRRFGDRAEAEAYLDLVGELLARLELAGDDRRFHFNPTGQTMYVLPLTINNRYIVCKGREVQGEVTWWLIHPGPHAALPEEAGEWLHHWPFAQKRYDPVQGAPVLVQYRAAFVRAHLARLFPPVLEVARRERDACRGTTPCRLAHSADAYALALDDGARAEQLPGLAFGPAKRERRPRVSGGGAAR